MAFLDGTGRSPPLWYLKHKMAELWGVLPSEIDNLPGKTVMRQFTIWRLEGEAQKHG